MSPLVSITRNFENKKRHSYYFGDCTIGFINGCGEGWPAILSDAEFARSQSERPWLLDWHLNEDLFIRTKRHENSNSILAVDDSPLPYLSLEYLLRSASEDVEKVEFSVILAAPPKYILFGLIQGYSDPAILETTIHFKDGRKILADLSQLEEGSKTGHLLNLTGDRDLLEKLCDSVETLINSRSELILEYRRESKERLFDEQGISRSTRYICDKLYG